jgi:hypothetical protein
MLALSLALGVLYLFRSGPILFRRADKGNLLSEASFAIFNPIRDRSPERCAETFLEQLRQGECDRAVAELPEDQRRMCYWELMETLAAWRLTDRHETPNAVRLSFWYTAQDTKYDGPMSVTTAKTDGRVACYPVRTILLENRENRIQNRSKF